MYVRIPDDLNVSLGIKKKLYDTVNDSSQPAPVSWMRMKCRYTRDCSTYRRIARTICTRESGWVKRNARTTYYS